MLCDNLEGWDGVGGRREVQKGRDIDILIHVETNTIFQSNYPPIKNKLINKKRKNKTKLQQTLCVPMTQTIDFHLPRIIIGLPRWCQW